MTDYLLYCLLKTAGPLIRILPLPAVFFIGRRLGDLAWCIDLRHRSRAYSQIKTAFGADHSPAELRNICRDFYRSFGENAMEMLLIPKMDKGYIEKNIRIHGREHVQDAFKRGKGVIFVAVHAGGWEIANILCANLGVPFSMFVRQQKWPMAEKLLDGYRRQKGCRLIKREEELRSLLRLLKANEATVLTVDQGGRTGTNVRFFGREASMASGAVRLAMKYGAALVPVFPVRVKDQRVDFYVEPPFQPVSTGDEEKDIRSNLQELVAVFERFIRSRPQTYLWTYRIWKYGRQKNILIISDGKAGHQRQSEAVAAQVRDHYQAKGYAVDIRTIQIEYKNRFGRLGIALAGCLSGKYICQGCLKCAAVSLSPASYKELTSYSADLVVSTGSAAAAVNYLIARQNQARSLVVMRPALQALDRFSGVIIPRHDLGRGRLPGNAAVVDGSLNLIDKDYLERNAAALSAACSFQRPAGKPVIGVLIGGDNKDFRLDPAAMRTALGRIKAAAAALDGRILLTTSRRTCAAVEKVCREELAGFPRCGLLVIANEKNYPFAVGGILGLSDIVVVTCESISMISEAVAGPANAIVLQTGRLGRRHSRFLDYFRKSGYCVLARPDALGPVIEDFWYNKPVRLRPDNAAAIRELLQKVL